MIVRFLLVILVILPGTIAGQPGGLPADHDGKKQPGLIPAERILTDTELLDAVQPGIPELRLFYQQRKAGETAAAIKTLMAYLKEKLAGRYYFSWKNFPERFETYRRQYPAQYAEHQRLATYQMSHYAPETRWQLPFQNRLGEDVSAYELRHLARQQKSADMALMFFYEHQNDIYRDYFVRQAADLNRAFTRGEYDDAGNGIYERFRAGKRVHNWLFCHFAYLSSPGYDWRNQLLLTKTFLHHGAQLARRTGKFSYGNHHTKGLVALFQIATLFPEFSESARWRQQAIDGLVDHLTREVNDDGFQFERSVHYHQGDIDNYFRVYQLARLNDIPLPPVFDTQFKKMFIALVHIAQPNRRTPVLQDDTDAPYTENNRIDGAMTLGTLLYDDPVFKYFSGDSIPAEVYWLLRPEQIERFQSQPGAPPRVASAALRETGYYVMRNGWSENDAQMVISAGLSEHKPDHQHGEMLSLTAYANGHEILPNYQVSYSKPDFRYWKNSWVKSVALVDSIPLGRGWRQNRGKSGFGKWANLPRPAVLAWSSGEDADHFAGSHDGYDSLGIVYHREVMFIKDGFWMVQDHYQAPEPHRYQQIWQGHYQPHQAGNWVRSVFEDGSGLDIYQMNGEGLQIDFGGRDGKGNVMFTSDHQRQFSFVTLLFPFNAAENGLKAAANGRGMIAGAWEVMQDVTGKNFDQDGGESAVKMVISGKNGKRIFWPARPGNTLPEVYLLDGRALQQARDALRAGDRHLAPAFERLCREADHALKSGPYSVMQKTVIPPGGDKHDYISMGPYWWPNPDTPDGLPYIRRDGEVNPERNQYDKIPGAEMSQNTLTLGLAYFYSGNRSYAARAAALVRAWFLEDSSRMNPNLDYGQFIPGRSSGRGVGIIETRNFCKVIDAVGLIAGSGEWRESDQNGLKAWFDAYLQWLLSSENGLDEARRQNNHGTWYDVQVSMFAMFAGRDSLARQVLEAFPEKRIMTQIEPDGRQPLELSRTRSFMYSVMNLEGMFAAAALAERLKLNLWNFTGRDGSSLPKAVAFLMPYATGDREWPYPQITGWEEPRELFAALLRRAPAGMSFKQQVQATSPLTDSNILHGQLYLLFPPGDND